MKKYLLFSLCAVTPLLMQAEQRGLEFENEVFANDDELVYENIHEDLLSDEENADLVLETEKLKMEKTEELTYKNNDNNAYPSAVSTQTSSGKTVPAYKLPINHSGSFVDLEFLYWKLDETGMDFAVHKKQGQSVFFNGTQISYEAVGKVDAIDFEWSPGFRVGLGHRFARDLWELAGVYTFYYTDGSKNDKVTHFYGDDNVLKAPDTEYLKATIDAPIATIIEAKANAHFWYHIGDVQLAREFILTPFISLRFLVGPTIAFIQQKFHMSFADNFFTDNGITATPSQRVTEQFNWKFKGGGLKLGLDSHWSLGRGFNLLFQGALSSVYGSYTNTLHGFLQGSHGPVPSPSGLLSDTKIKQGRVVFSSQIAAGLGWNLIFDNWNAEFSLKYELNTWFNLTDQYRGISNIGIEGFNNDWFRELQTPPLNLQGITVGANINF